MSVKVEKQEVLDDVNVKVEEQEEFCTEDPYCGQYDEEVATASSAMPVKAEDVLDLLVDISDEDETVKEEAVEAKIEKEEIVGFIHDGVAEEEPVQEDEWEEWEAEVDEPSSGAASSSQTTPKPSSSRPKPSAFVQYSEMSRAAKSRALKKASPRAEEIHQHKIQKGIEQRERRDERRKYEALGLAVPAHLAKRAATPSRKEQQNKAGINYGPYPKSSVEYGPRPPAFPPPAGFRLPPAPPPPPPPPPPKTSSIPAPVPIHSSHVQPQQMWAAGANVVQQRQLWSVQQEQMWPVQQEQMWSHVQQSQMQPAIIFQPQITIATTPGMQQTPLVETPPVVQPVIEPQPVEEPHTTTSKSSAEAAGSGGRRPTAQKSKMPGSTPPWRQTRTQSKAWD